MSESRPFYLPDEEGHYSREALELDKVSHRHLPAGKHPVDEIANELAACESRRRFFSLGMKGIGGLALATVLSKSQALAAPAASSGALAGLPHFP
ncbi:MAG TPA: hypothetical protein VE621_19045, partial [Bryobacteraceae bacterium]|nr:hypothetical protein [Bryobacteraceae bacterium]